VASSAATSDYNDVEFVVEGGQVLADDALEALAQLLIDLVENELERRSQNCEGDE
jgi:hypothetical protein